METHATGYGPVTVHSPSLRERYDAYCQSQGRELLNIIPREGVRSLLRHFGGEHRVASLSGDEDLLEWLARRCRDLLPLPPFEEWVSDFRSGRSAYVAVPGPPMAPRTADGAPVTVDLRSVRYHGEEWVAALALRPQDDQWVGHIRFHLHDAVSAYTTAEVFREPSPVEVRERFHSFDDRTLGAFLRSALP